MREKRATIKDVAARSGASIATVSRVLSNADYPVSSELRTRVEEAARELAFAYTVAPRQSKNQDARTLALVIPNMSNPFYMETIHGISSVCYEKKYQLVLCNSQWDEARETFFLQDLYNRRISGVIISSISDSPSSLASYAERGMAIIQLDQRFDGDASFSINYDSRLGARLAVRHLIEKGHKQIAFASTPLTRWTRKEIYKGYTEQLKKAEIMPDEKLTFISDSEDPGNWDNYEVHAGEEIARRIMESSSKPTAVFCVNDMVAFGVMSGFSALGVSVPEDISVIGFDDIPLARMFIPALTTVHCPAYETGRLSAIMLIDKIESGALSATPLNMHLQPSLVERGSVKSVL